MSVAALDLAAASSFCRRDSCPRSLSSIFCCSAWRRAVNSRRARSASLFAAATDAWEVEQRQTGWGVYIPVSAEGMGAKKRVPSA